MFNGVAKDTCECTPVLLCHSHKFSIFGRHKQNASQLKPDHFADVPWLGQPFKELRKTVDLIVMFAIWKKGDFTVEFREPRRFGRDSDTSTFDQARDAKHAGCFVVPGDDPTDVKGAVGL